MICHKPWSIVLPSLICTLLAGSLLAAEPSAPAQPLPQKLEISPGPFQPTETSLKQYRCPDWFRDAKLGIWAVWGPESVPQQGDWYARNLSQGKWVQDLERGVMNDIRAEPWQTDTCVGGWYYDVNLAKSHGYKSAATVIQMLADIVSKNGNLLLNFPPRPDGTLDDDELQILDEMAQWMPSNGEAIFGTRPWKIFGEGAGKIQGGMFNEGNLRYTAKDIRFTSKGDMLYAIVLGWPESGKLVIHSLAASAGRITEVALLGHPDKLTWSQTEEGLVVTLPGQKPCKHAFALKVCGGDLKPAPLPPAPPIGPATDGKLSLPAAEAEIHGTSPQYESGGEQDQIGFWANPQDFVSWNIRIAKVGAYDVGLEIKP